MREAAERAKEIERPLLLVYLNQSHFLETETVDVHGPEDLDEHFAKMGKIILKRHRKLAEEITGIVDTEILEGWPSEVIVKLVDQQEISEVYFSSIAFDILQKADETDLGKGIADAGAEVHVVWKPGESPRSR